MSAGMQQYIPAGTEFDPAKLRVVGKLSWMKDEDEDHWFSVPSSNTQLIFSEDGTYAHALTGIRIEVLHFWDWGAGDQLEAWTGKHPQEGGAPRFSTLVENGEAIYEALTESTFEFWSTDAAHVQRWVSTNVVFVERFSQFKVLPRRQLETFLKNQRLAVSKKRREDRIQRREQIAQRKIESTAHFAEVARQRAAPEYEHLFTVIYGKPQADLTKDDPIQAVWCARVVVEFRLKIGRWAVSTQ